MKQYSLSSARLFVILVFALLVASLAPAALAQTKSFNWGNWDVDITVQPNGDLRVTETQTLNFSGAPFTFGYREIPTGRSGNNDGITDVRVFEGDQEYRESSSNGPGTFEVVDQGDMTRINWFFEPALGSRTYTFSYTVRNGVIVGPEGEEGSGDQVYWTVIPVDIPSYVQKTTATVRLPEGVQPQMYTGTTDYLVAGYVNDIEEPGTAITVSPDGRDTTFVLDRTLAQGEKFDVRVQFPHGALPIEMASWQTAQQREDVIGLIAVALSALLLVGGPLGILLLWYLRGRDPQLGVVIPEYITEPPDGLPPAMAGTLIDEKVDMQDIVSTLIDLASRGYLTMTEEKKDHTFNRTEKSDADLRPYEQTMLRKFFGKSDERTLSSLQYKFASNLGDLRSKIYDQLVTEGYVPRSPHTVRTSYLGLAFTVFFGGIGALFLLGMFLGDNFGIVCIPALAILITAIALGIASRYMPRKTMKGAESAAKWQAFKQYLTNIDRYSDLEQAGDIFGKYLGYAVAFGLERSFIKKFSDVPGTPIPPWYMPYPPIYTGGGWGAPGPVATGGYGGSGGGANIPSMPRPTLEGMSGGLTGGLAGMSAGLTRMLNSTSNVLKSTPPPSNTGGGYRGGGFGGGGGFSGGFSGGSSGGGGGGGFG